MIQQIMCSSKQTLCEESAFIARFESTTEQQHCEAFWYKCCERNKSTVFLTHCEYEAYFTQTVTPSLWPFAVAGFLNYLLDILLSPKLYKELFELAFCSMLSVFFRGILFFLSLFSFKTHLLLKRIVGGIHCYSTGRAAEVRGDTIKEKS